MKKLELRTAEEWEAWARAKTKNEMHILTSEEMEELEIGDCIEFDATNPLKQRIVHYSDCEGIPPNYIEKETKNA